MYNKSGDIIRLYIDLIPFFKFSKTIKQQKNAEKKETLI